MDVIDNQRIVWIDIFKGILITLMVIGHTSSPWTTYIYLFHMPAFIFISGYTTKISKYDTFTYIKRKTLSLLAPYFIINSIYILLCLILVYIGKYEYFYSNEFILNTQIHRLFLNMSTIDLGGATWFIVVLYFIEIQYKILYEFCKKINMPNLLDILCLGLFILSSYTIKSKVYLPYLLDLSYLGILFFALGRGFRKYKVFEKQIDHKIMLIISISIFIIFGKICFVRMNWPTREFDSIFISLITSICGIYLLYLIGKYVAKTKYIRLVFSEIGKKTYPILILHFLVFRMIFLIMYRLNMVNKEHLKELVPLAGNKYWPILTVITVVTCYLIAKLAEKNFLSDYIVNANFVFKKKKEIRADGDE